jgi:perosamine synthetase
MRPRNIQLAKPSFDEREIDAVRRVLASGRVVQGPEVKAFEDTLAAMLQVRHCIAVSSGTAALHTCYLALGIGPGDAVFIPSFAWPSAANTTMQVGARPVFIDVLPETYNIDPADLKTRVRECLKRNWGTPCAAVPVHEFGLAVEMKSVLSIAQEYDLIVIEDAACALGATLHDTPVGTFGKIGILSFHPRKAITVGEGGAIVTNDDNLAEKCRLWRNHGQAVIDGKRNFEVAGLNYRLTEIQAAIGRVQLEKFPEILGRRKKIAGWYFEHLSPAPEYDLPENNPEHTWQTFMVVLGDHFDRAEVIEKMAAKGIETGPGTMSAHCLKAYQEKFHYTDSDLPVSHRLHDKGLALPLHSFMTENDVIRVSLALAEATKGANVVAG